ncbi:Magnesium-protoporphyrin O-methyltransferase [Rhodobacteraceae bacterium THAF1]|uniref:magnesium protoporphyrin IX methyltransferase n=1 Tax=Palleronia sp. THAF1 TaxID=2587842 RepID=UPI000F3DBA71|nr:magnesium protoporphyrin IX methyltransferase [Palleronia sp. THAF1]QFU10260.1 Magnesium-protoporphyrin O-methyltransferase [Palleronia sp. THAF1]VDC16835.1 Magnesium-protoporphyrin O-methyltransferase [Rhodobacteraceae bacterium THAF1]
MPDAIPSLDARRALDRWTPTRERVKDYFDSTATDTWARLTSDEKVSRIRETVRAGRDRMRALMLSRLPEDLSGCRVLDAGCGVGQMSQALAERGAEVVAVDIAPAILDVAKRRMPEELRDRVTFIAGDLSDDGLGDFDHVVAMDSLIYYEAAEICSTLASLDPRVSGKIVFTVAPSTPMLMMMWGAGRLFPKADRAPVMVPQSPKRLARQLTKAGCVRLLRPVERVNSGFYISHCMEVLP